MMRYIARALVCLSVLSFALSARAQEPAPPEAAAALESSAQPEEQPPATAQPAAVPPAPVPAMEEIVAATAPTDEAGDEDAATAQQAAGGPSEWDRWFGGKFMDTRVTFVFTDDNVLAGPRDRSPQGAFFNVNDRQFYENLDTEKRGRENETQLVLYKRMPSYFHRLDAEAALVLQMQVGNEETTIGDNGSYLKLNFYTQRDDFDGDNVSLTFFPVDSQRMLLGYTYDITWGGEKIFPNNTGTVPGLRLRYDFNVGELHEGYVYAGMKTAQLLNQDIDETQTYYGGLGGFGVNLTRWLGFDLSGGYFQRGAFPPQSYSGDTSEEGGEDVDTGIGGLTMDAFGGSARVVFHQGMPIADSVDFRLYKVVPDLGQVIAAPQNYSGKLAWSVSGEYTMVAQALIKFEESDSSEYVPSSAAAINAKLRIAKTRLHADFIYRDLSYVVFDRPGVYPYHGYPDGADVTPEWFIAAGVDYFFETPHLTPGLIFAYKRPAAYTETDANGDEISTVFRSLSDYEILPNGEKPFDILSLKATLKWDVAQFFAIIGELRYTLDKNKSKIGDNSERIFEEKNVTNELGFAILAQAKW